MLNNLFSFTDNSSSNFSKKIFLKTSSKFLYSLLVIMYSILKILIVPFQRRFITMYSAKLQADRLPFRIIPGSVKKFLILIASTDLWILFFKRIKNKNNIFIIREKKNALIHRFWCILYKSEITNFTELNVKRKFSQKTVNVYATFCIEGHPEMNLNFILFYYVNKIVLLTYPYYYWTYTHLYHRYDTLPNATKQSRNNKELIVFLCIDSVKQFFSKDYEGSFVKTTLTNFRGVRNTLKNLENISRVEITASTKLLQDTIKKPLTDRGNLLERDVLRSYNTFFRTNALNLKFHLNSIIYNNTYLFLKHSRNKINKTTQFLNIQWYNKVHNSIIDVTKSNIIMYLRTARHFNKGRYSRNRQIYRTGVYWCIWLNVVIVYALHYYFYRVVFSFGYLWLPLGLMILVMFSSRLYKYRYYDVNQLLNEFKDFNNFIYYNVVFCKNNYNQVLINVHTLAMKFFKNYTYLFSGLFTVNSK